MDASLFYAIVRDTASIDYYPYFKGPFHSLDEAKAKASADSEIEKHPTWQTIIILVRPEGIVEQMVVGKYVPSTATEFKWV